MCPQLDYAVEAPPDITDDRLIITADQGVLEQEGLSMLAGAVKLQQAGKEFSAQALDYDSATRQVHVRMESLFRNRDFIIKSRRVDFDLNTETGVFNETEFTLPQRAARGEASIITLNSQGTAEFRLGQYTTCAPGSRGWYLRAHNITLDHAEGLGTAKNARLTFLGVPILYLPYFRFPIDDRRRSGMLFPTIGQSDQTGFDFRWPVYLNLGPNYDATLTPRIMSKRGFQVGTESRYLLERGTGELRYDFLTTDMVTQESRDYFQLDHSGLINQRLSLQAHIANASDREYFEDLGGQVDAASTIYLDRSVLLTYQAPSAYTITALVQDYQTIATTVLPQDEPYRRLPQVRLNFRTKNSIASTRLGLSSEYANFQRANNTQNTQGQRLHLQPYLLTELDRNTWFFSSESRLNYSYYQLTDTLPGAADQPTRTLPQFNLGGGLRFERLTASGKLQTLEPQLFYLYTPFRDQTQLPLFDSGEPDFDFTQLFARNRFSGEDRIADASHLALSATSRLLDPLSGMQRLSASVGQIFRFITPRVQLPGSFNAPEEGATDFIASLDYRLSSAWSAGFSTQWSPDDRKLNRSSVSLRYREDNRRFDVSYRYRQNILEQADIAIAMPVLTSWSISGRSRYSLQDHTALDNILGVEYSTCCWALQTSYRRFISNARGDFDSGVYLQLNLKGLTRLGSGYAGLDAADQVSENITYR